jgi:orotate phosphoribosyltransferase
MGSQSLHQGGSQVTGAEEVEGIFKESGAILEGHFQLASGLHSATYWEKFRVLQYPHYTQRLCALIAHRFEPENVQVVAGPTVGGVVIAFEVARQLGVRSIFAEREGGGRAFKRNFSLASGERVLVVDDVLTTGSSVRDVMAEVEKHGGMVAGVGVLINRAEGEVDFGVPFFCCHRAIVPAYAPEECPLCAAGIPLIKLGSTPSLP